MATGTSATSLPVSSSSLSKEKNNFARLSRLLIDIGTPVLRDVFDSNYHPATLQAFLNSHPVHTTLNDLRAKRVVYTKQWKKLYPGPGLSVSSKDFDISLLFILLRNVCDLAAPTGTGWNKQPTATDTSLEADLVRIKLGRNELYAHSVEMVLDDVQFTSSWTEIEAALNRLAKSRYADDIHRLKIQSLDSELETFDHDLFLSWEESEEKIIDAIQELDKKFIKDRQEIEERTIDALQKLDDKITKGRKAELAIQGKVKLVTAGGLVAAWAAGSAYIINRYIDDPQNMVLLITVAIAPATVPIGWAVKRIIDGSFQIIFEVYSVQALDDLWESNKRNELQKKLQEVLVTDELKRLAPKDTKRVEVSITITKDDYVKARDTLQQSEIEEERRKKPFCTLPQKPSHDTVIRHDEVSMTIEKMKQLRTTYPNHVTVTYLSGNPGCGKSELARQIGEKYFDEADKEESSKFVGTLNASNLDTLIQSYMELACQLGCNEVSLTTIMESENTSQEQKIHRLQALTLPMIQMYSVWLMIIDNVEDIQMVNMVIPHSGQKLIHGKGHILITTQDTQSIPASDSHVHHIKLSLGMKLHDAVQSLQAISGFPCNENLAKEVCEKLDFQPLALACAAVYVRQTRYTDPTMTWKGYLEEVDKGNEKLADEFYVKTSSSYKRSMTTAVEMAVKKASESSQVLQHTFEFMAEVAPELIPLQYVIKYVLQCMPDLSENSIAEEITSSSLIITSEHDSTADKSNRMSVRVHQVVYYVLQSVYRSAFQQQVSELSFLMKFANVFSYINGMDKIGVDFIKYTGPLIQHFECISPKIRQYLEENEILKVLSQGNLYGVHYQANKLFTHHEYIPLAMFLTNIVSVVFIEHGKYDSARMLLEISYSLTENNQDNDKNVQALVTVLQQLGRVLRFLDADDQAKECFEKVLTTQEGIFGPNHLHVATALIDYGTLLDKQGKFGEAKECYEKGMAIQKCAYGSNHLNMAATLNNLGIVLNKLGKLDEAKECFEKALENQESAYGSNHPDVAKTLNNLGSLLDELGKFGEAKECYEDALAIQESAYGSNHPDVSATRNNLGIVFNELGKLDEAKECYEKALAIKESAYGSNHPNVAKTLNNLGSLLDGLGKLDEAKECYEKALVIEESAYGSNHPKVAATLNNLGIVLHKLRKLDEGKECYEKALAIQESTYGSNHPDVAATLNNLGSLLKELRKLGEAKECYENALAIQESAYGSNHPDVAATRNNLGIVFNELGKLDKAKECYEKALAIEESAYGSNHPDVAKTLNNLGSLLDELEKIDEAKECYQKALVIEESAYGSNHAKVAATLNNLGIVLNKLRKLDEAKECYEKALAIQESAYGSNHPDVAATLNNLGSLLNELGKLDEAKECYEKALAIEESAFGSNHPDVAGALNNLGIVLNKLGKLDEAKECYEKALAIQESAYGSNHLIVATTLNNLGIVLHKLRKLDEAKECYEEALAIKETAYGSNHPNVAKTLNNLGSLLKELGKFDEAKECYEKALAIKESAYGSNHPDVAATRNNLGILLKKLRNLDEAKECYEKAQATQESAYGRNFTEVAATLNKLGTVLKRMRKLDEAKECYENALAIQESAYGSNHPDVAATRNNLGSLLKELGKRNKNRVLRKSTGNRRKCFWQN